MALFGFGNEGLACTVCGAYAQSHMHALATPCAAPKAQPMIAERLRSIAIPIATAASANSIQDACGVQLWTELKRDTLLCAHLSRNGLLVTLPLSGLLALRTGYLCVSRDLLMARSSFAQQFALSETSYY
eukprot:4018899-Amphidinium_carterae.1